MEFVCGNKLLCLSVEREKNRTVGCWHCKVQAGEGLVFTGNGCLGVVTLLDGDFLTELRQSDRQGDCKKALICHDNRAATAADCDERRSGMQDWTNDRPEPKQF